MKNLVKFTFISLSTLSLLFACQNPSTQSPELAKAEALTSKANFIKYFESCVLNNSSLKEDQKANIKSQLELVKNIPDITWQSASPTFNSLFEYCENKNTSSSASPVPSSSSQPNVSPSPALTPSGSASGVFATRLTFKAYLESCVINSPELPDYMKSPTKILISLMDNVKDERWPPMVEAYTKTYGKYEASCGKSTSQSVTPVAPTTFGELSCDQEGKLKSGTGKSINVTFANNTGKNIKIYWLDFNGKRVAYNKNLLDKATFTQQTFITHPWLIADSDDKCIKILAPDASGTIDIK